ncbi:hypothetical protein [Desulfofarcimen acetoxidans]|uniref:hypothetical protein n=1 Tax=Desulfofarcimen acetoxidans TaxID=58138 RepID=UPI00019E4B2A|nr:hypothetical protein [Desulfofarcimen acetoxidans]
MGIAQVISELLEKCQFKKFIILDNFHNLNEEIQKALAFDLRLFQEKGYRFIILGVWREKNRLIQFNGDLVDRIMEIPVEPWVEHEFKTVIDNGCAHLNISIGTEIISRIISVAFGSIGTVQELCKELCFVAGIRVKTLSHFEINNQDFIEQAIKIKVEEYSSRHLRALESIATAGVQVQGLSMPYYVIRTIIEMDITDLLDGLSRMDLQDKIKAIHYRPDSVRPSDISYVLHGLSEIQNNKIIVPPLLDYDRLNRRLRIIDSTLFFFLKFKNKQELLEEIPSPLDNDRER